MKYSYYLIVLLASSLLLGCAQSGKITCEDPYILVGTSCCLDVNHNKICDDQEATMLKPEEAKEDMMPESPAPTPEAEQEPEEVAEPEDYYSQTFQPPVEKEEEPEQYVYEEPEPVKTSVPASGMMKLHVLDIKDRGGQSLVLETPSGKLVMVDVSTKAYGPVISRYLANLGASNIDLFIASTMSDEAVGGFRTIYEDYPINMVVDNGAKSNTFQYYVYDTFGRKGNYKTIKSDSTIDTGDGVTIDIIVPYDSVPLNKLQHTDSLVVKATYKDVSFLMMNYCVGLCEDAALESNLDADVVVLADHGNSGGTSSRFIEASMPRFAALNSHEQINARTSHRLEAYDVVVLNTYDYGDLTFSTDGSKLSVDSNKIENPGSIVIGTVKTVNKYY